MTTKRNKLMYEVENYGNGLLSDETIERTVDILMECDPVPDSIYGIDIASVIQAVECRDAEHLSDVYDLEYDFDDHDWCASFYAVNAYLHVGDVDRKDVERDAESYPLRYFSNRTLKYRYTNLHIGDVDRKYAENYALRYFSNLEWSIRYIVRFPGSSMLTELYSEMNAAVKRAYEYAMQSDDDATVLEIACTIDPQGDPVDSYVIRRISK